MKRQISSGVFVMGDEINMENLPAGWKRNEKGFFEYTMFPDEIKEMRRREKVLLSLAILNIIQFLIITISVLYYFCGH